MAKSNEVGVKYIDARGEFVEANDVSAAFVVNMNDRNANDFIQGVKKRTLGEAKKPVRRNSRA